MSFVYPPTLQMYTGQVVTVFVTNNKDFELYTLDPAPGQATPITDVASTGIQNLTSMLGSIGALGSSVTVAQPAAQAAGGAAGVSGPNQPTFDAHISALDMGKPISKTVHRGAVDPCLKDPLITTCKIERTLEALREDLKERQDKLDKDQKDKADKARAIEDAKRLKGELPEQQFGICDFDHLSQFSSFDCMRMALTDASHQLVDQSLKSIDVYQQLQFLLTPDAQPLRTYSGVSVQSLVDELCGVPRPGGSRVPCALAPMGGVLYSEARASAYAAAVLSRITKPLSSVITPADKTSLPMSQELLNAMQLVAEEQAALDAIRKDLEGYAQRLQDLQAHPPSTDGELGEIHDTAIRSYWQSARTANYYLNSLNLVTTSQQAANDGSKKVKLIAITVVYGDSKWEASTGAGVVFRPIRTFAISPSIDVSTLTQNGTFISETKASPEVVPFALADYRLGSELQRAKWRMAFYGSFGIGYNTSQKSADFLLGPSLSWRGLLVSTLCDFGKGSRLANGFTVGEPLPTTAAPSTIPTVNYWEPALTIGISVRVPPISGR